MDEIIVKFNEENDGRDDERKERVAMISDSINISIAMYCGHSFQ